MIRFVMLLCVVMLAAACGAKKPTALSNDTTPAPPRKPVIVWLDESFQRQQGASLAQWMADAHAAGVTHVAFEARDASGVFIDPQKKSAARAAASAAGLRIAAVLPLFVAEQNTPDSLLSQRAVWNGNAFESNTGDGKTPRRLSPVVTANRQREADAVRVLASDDRADYIIVSGCGFEDTLADLSPAAREAYESWAGISTLRWPLEIIGENPGYAPIGPAGRGPLWSNWMLWRATNMRDFLFSLREAVNVAPGGAHAQLVVLVDAPYPAHQREGLNWAGAQSTAISDFAWLGSAYKGTAAGHLVDVVALGFWKTALTAEDAQRDGDAWWSSIEGASAAARKYLPPETKRWGAIVMGQNENWRAAASRAYQLNDGLILIGAKNLQSAGELKDALSVR
ncbi:MAG: hypothetical protein ABI579_04820 [Candidatus Sumerlaeota bacterium]